MDTAIIHWHPGEQRLHQLEGCVGGVLGVCQVNPLQVMQLFYTDVLVNKDCIS